MSDKDYGHLLAIIDSSTSTTQRLIVILISFCEFLRYKSSS